MIDPEAMNDEVARLETLLREKLGARGKTFEARLKHAGRRLPSFARKAGRQIVKARAKLGHPRLATQVDFAAVGRAAETLRNHLSGIDPAERRKSLFLGLLGSVVFNLLLLAIMIVALLRWQGVI